MPRQAASWTILLGAAIAWWALLPPPATAQQQQQPTVAGVEVDAQGVLRMRVLYDPLRAQRIAAARATLNRDVIPFSRLRKISLPRLERVIVQHNGVLTDEMRYLAGLLRARYVFYYPQTKDIVVAGPAEGWVTDAAGRVVGMRSGRPVVQLQDLAVALRTFPPGKSGPQVIGCSIDPTPEGLASVQQFLQSMGTTFMAGQEQMVAARAIDGLPKAMGMQKVTIKGVSPNTHFAQVLVEADYRMKLIGLGLERPPVRMVSFIDRVNPSQVARNALFRWYFVPDYQCVRMSEDGLAMELVGDGVKLVGEEEMVDLRGERGRANRSNPASQAFVTSFTQRYPALADRSPVYAELRNLIDLAVLAAFIQQQDYYGKAGWSMEFFGDERAYAIETYPAPKLVEPTVAAVMKGARLMTPIAGGVHIEAQLAIKPENLLPDPDQELSKTRRAITPELAPGQWWWD
ncbi:MAG: DUF1598 domain-containing protein [Thermoguttaceae bacterium]